MKLKNILIVATLSIFTFFSCDDDNNTPTFPPVEPPVYDMTGFSKGADVSWITEMEKAGRKFYNADGVEAECMALMRELGMNSIRLRVWVNPANGWCNKDDMLIKAWRAHQLGFRLMIDFHYSDSWADPGQQTKPAAWNDYTFEELKEAVAAHTEDVLTGLKNNGITPEWVQVGNETGGGMLWEDGRDPEKYAQLNNAGYDVAKSIFPETKVIIHVHNGYENSRFRNVFDKLKNNNGKWDVIGMSLYPSADNWQEYNELCIANVDDMIDRYPGTEVMICEVGMPWDEAEICKAFLTDLIAKCKNAKEEKCLGVFYWEPQSYGSWNGYTLGAFDDEGRPTVAMDAFK